MTTKTSAVELLDKYFEEKGRVLNMGEYKTARDAPIRYQILVQLFGNWNKVERIMLARRTTEQVVSTNVADVLAEIAAQENAEREGTTVTEVTEVTEEVKELTPIKGLAKPVNAAKK